MGLLNHINILPFSKRNNNNNNNKNKDGISRA